MASKKRKNRYIPGIAAMRFKPDLDWTSEEALSLYQESNAKVKLDEISFSDCISGMKNMPSECVDLIIADPPFGIEFSTKENLYNRKSEFVPSGYEEVSSDDYFGFTKAWIEELPRILKVTGSVYIFSGWTHLKEILGALNNTKLSLVNHLIWKYQFGVFTRRKYVTSHYHILFCVRDTKRYFFNKIEHYPEDVWVIPRKYKPGQRKNRTKLPEKVVSRCIHFSSKPGDLIFDPFVGNGTSAVCAKANFRHYYGFEINQNLQDIIQANLNNTKLGEDYVPYTKLIPSMEELAKKYPAVRKELSKKSPNFKKSN